MAQKQSAPPPESPASLSDYFAHVDREKFARNLFQVALQSRQLMTDFLTRWARRENPGPLDPLNLSGAFFSLLNAMGSDRETVMETQLRLWRDWTGLWEGTARRMLGDGNVSPLAAPAPGDRRFRDAEWQQNEIFDFIKQSYLGEYFFPVGRKTWTIYKFISF